MSKIEKELREATDLSTKRGEGRQDFLARLMTEVAKLSDGEWDKLSEAAQGWFNKAADAKNAKEPDVPDFPDVEKAEEPATTSRRGTRTADTAPKVGDEAEVTTKRGRKVKGTIVELDAKLVVLKTADGEEEFDRERLEMLEVFHGTAGKANDEPADPLAKGATVNIKTKRGREVTGKIVELDDELLVLEVDGKEEEFARDRVESITPAGGAKAATTSTRRSAAVAQEPAAGEAEKKRSSNPGGVSVGQRIRELMSEDTDITEEGVGKILDKEKLEYKATSLRMNYADNKKFLDCLKAAKRLK